MKNGKETRGIDRWVRGSAGVWRSGWIFVVGLAVLAAACGSRQPCASDEHECGFDVYFSFANQDRTTPVALTDVVADGTTIFHGALGMSQSGDYIYMNTRVMNHKLTLEVRSEAAEQVISQKKNIWVDHRAWIVITRVTDYDGNPEIRIEVSYENPAILNAEKDKHVSSIP